MSSSTAAREAARQNNGKFGTQHRDVVDVPLDDQPTMTVRLDGTREWRLNGVLHRLDGPAIEWAHGDREFWVGGKRHRTDGPAAERASYRVWLVNDEPHRLDGPAVEYANGSREFWMNGNLHRLDGPAIENADGTQEFWLNGRKYATEADWQKAVEATNNTTKV